MARIDDLTREFMGKVAGPQANEPESQDPALSLKPLRVIKQITRGVEDPRKALGRVLVRAAAQEFIDKQGSVHVLGLYKFLNDHYGRNWWDWEPETIWAELHRDHFPEGTPEELKDMVMALQVLVNSNSPFEHWHIFENVSHALNSNPVMFDTLQPAEPDEIALTIKILEKIRPKQEYDREVLMYIAVCARSAGMVWLPEDLFPGVQLYLDEITFEHKFRDETKFLWEKGQPGSSDAEQIQIARLQEVREYVAEGLKNA